SKMGGRNAYDPLGYAIELTAQNPRQWTPHGELARLGPQSDSTPAITRANSRWAGHSEPGRSARSRSWTRWRANMSRFLRYCAAAIVPRAALLFVGKTAVGDGNEAGDGPAIQLLKVIPVPVNPANPSGGLYSFDISWVDQHAQTYYLADWSNTGVP